MIQTYEKETALFEKKLGSHDVKAHNIILNKLKSLESLLNVKGINPSETFEDNFFQDLLENVSDSFLLIMEILEILVLPSTSNKNNIITNEYKVKGASLALAILMNLRNYHLKNDVLLLFLLFSISFGAGMRFINMLHTATGVCQHWDTTINFFDKQLKTLDSQVKKLFPNEVPMVLLKDNINLYRGIKRHHRLSEKAGQKMWNFTGYGAILQNISGIKHLFIPV